MISTCRQGPARSFRRAAAVCAMCIFTALAAAKPASATPEIDAETDPHPLHWGWNTPHPDNDAAHVEIGLHRMVGEMIIVGLHGYSPRQRWPRRVARQIASGQIGGILLLDHNVRSKRQLIRFIEFFQKASSRGPILVSVDQEGGTVQRLSSRRGFTRIPSAKYIGRRMTLQNARILFTRMAEELADVGVNVNLGPVVDLDVNPRNRVIGGLQRSFGAQPDKVARYASAFVKAHRRAGVAPTLKHFPGHGSSFADSHNRFVDLTKTWTEAELKPFRDLVAAGLADMVMMGHLYHPRFADGPRTPATLSRRAIQIELRERLHFKGLVISDAMEMGAIRRGYTFEDSLIRAVNAGCDLLLLSNAFDADPQRGPKAKAILLKALRDGWIERARIEDAHKRIVALKTWIKAKSDERKAPENAPGPH